MSISIYAVTQVLIPLCFWPCRLPVLGSSTMQLHFVLKFISFYWFWAWRHLNRHPSLVVQTCVNCISGSALSRSLISRTFKVPALPWFCFLMLSIPKAFHLTARQRLYVPLLIPFVWGWLSVLHGFLTKPHQHLVSLLPKCSLASPGVKGSRSQLWRLWFSSQISGVHRWGYCTGSWQILIAKCACKPVGFFGPDSNVWKKTFVKRSGGGNGEGKKSTTFQMEWEPALYLHILSAVIDFRLLWLPCSNSEAFILSFLSCPKAGNRKWHV